MKEFLLSGLRMSLPLIFAAFGGMLSERSGVANIALESILLASSFAAASAVAVFHSTALGIGFGILAGVTVAVGFGLWALLFKADQIIVGMATNILIMGLLPLISYMLFNQTGQTPSLSIDQRISELWPFVVEAVAVISFTSYFFRYSRLGLRVRMAGENPHAIRTMGVSVLKTRLAALSICGAFCALGGIYMSIGVGSGYTRNMIAGRGFIALAALIFGNWRPVPTLLGCLLFGFADALQIVLQGVPILPGGGELPPHLLQALPYIITLFILVGWVGRARAPAAINQPGL
jgi:simple sugar transport system permease protein